MSSQVKAAQHTLPTNGVVDDSAAEKVTRPVDWATLETEFDPSPEVAEAVKQVFQDDAEILRHLA
ncbi:hypothetical protein Pan44_00380 [Caulifigura coniformis]|uniref:Uncharacterized protein n=1 Tax=Caulifigura coniformis TaxID=2527983 RepID=A0A517S7C6_9PLAN|nr:hypothetical protein [Caulifigura coniformis]QDT52031.1 hypothetical protein Pan44_00380 [Caulifigura coniformis]